MPENPFEVNSVEFGRMLGILQTIQTQIADMRSSMNQVVAEHSTRIAKLETQVTVLSQPKLAEKLADKVIWGILACAGAIIISAVLDYMRNT